MGQVSISGGSIEFNHGDGDVLRVTLHRTLRLPEDGKKHALPASLGAFPLKRVEDYSSRVPDSWRAHGGLFFPMWQREAMWIGFSHHGRSMACKVAAGKVNAVSGKLWTPELAPEIVGGGNDPIQDYMVVPPQQWIDGFNVGSGVIRQFVAMPLGGGHTVEAQVTGEEKFGGLQILSLSPKAGLLPRQQNILRSAGWSKNSGPLPGNYTLDTQSFGVDDDSFGSLGPVPSANTQTVDNRRRRLRFSKSAEMGLGQGGEITQKIYPDPHGVEVWDQGNAQRLYVHIVNSELYREITGELPPPSPITANHYNANKYPWFKAWDEEMGDVQGSNTLANVKTVDQVTTHKAVLISNGFPSTSVVKDGSW